MRKSLVFSLVGALTLLPTLARAQNAITQNGSVTVGEIGVFRQDRQLGGASQHFANTGLGVKPFSITDSFSNGLCSNSASTNGPYSVLCLGHDSSGNGIFTLDSFGGEPNRSLTARVNGVPIPFPGTVSGTPFVADDATLALSSTATSATYVRLDYTAGNGAPPLNFTAQIGSCAANSMVNDGGSCRNSANGNSWKARHVGMPDIRQWGCKPDDSTDIVPCMAAAFAANLGPVYVPPGMWRVSTAATFSGHNPAFVGAGWDEFNQNAACPTTSNVKGTWFHRVAGSAGIVPFTISGAGAQGSGGFKHVAFCEDHPTPAGGWAPTAYNQWFQFNDVAGEFGFDDVYAFAINKFINYQGSGGALTVGRLNMWHIRGQVFTYFMNADYALDVIHGGDFHLWPFWSGNVNVLTYTDANARAFDLKRVDGFMIENVFLNNFVDGVLLSSSVNGSTTFASFPNYYCDVCKNSIHVTGNNVVAHFGNSFLAGGFIPGSYGVLMDGTAAGNFVFIDSMHCSGMGVSCIFLAGAGANTTTVNASWMHDYNHDNIAATAINGGTNNFIKMATRPQTGGSNNGGAVVNANSGALYEIPIQLLFAAGQPGLAGTTTAGTPTYTLQNGWYMLNGNQVTVSFQINTSAFGGSPTGNAAITGLPYTSSIFAVDPGRCHITYYSGVTFGAGYTSLSGEVESNGTRILLFESGAGATPQTQQLPVSALSGSILAGSCTYRIQ